MSAEPCTNGACKKTLDDAYTCSLCRSPSYCSEECRHHDWVVHSKACENVVRVSSENMGFAVPYMYEDYLPQAELNRLPVTDPVFHEYAVVHANPNRTVTSFIIPALVGKDAESKDDEAPIARGRDPKPYLDLYTTKKEDGGYKNGAAYVIQIEFEENPPGVEVTGDIKNDMIYKENTSNETARALSGGGTNFKERAKNVLTGGLRRAMKHKEDSYIFWPGVAGVVKHDIRVPLRGSFRIDLWLKNPNNSKTHVSFVRGGYSLPRAGKDTVSAAARKVQQMFRTQVEMKFKGTSLTTKNLYVRRYSDFDGNGVIMTFQVGEGEEKAQLVDVEYIAGNLRVESVISKFQNPMGRATHEAAPAETFGDNTKKLLAPEAEEEAPPPPPDYDQAQIHCNASDYDHVVGLAMALDFHIATNADEFESEKLKQLEQSCAIIKDYAHTMEANNGAAPEHIPNNVSTAINHAVDSLYYEPIGLQSRYEIKISRSPGTVLVETSNIIEELKKYDEEKASLTLKGFQLTKATIRRNTILIPRLKKIRSAAQKIMLKETLLSDTAKVTIKEIIEAINKYNPGFAT